MAANQTQGNGAALQVWLTEQKCPQWTRTLLAQVTQRTGQAAQRQHTAREYPRLIVAAEDNFANQAALAERYAESQCFAAAGAAMNLTQHLNVKLTLAEF